MHVLFLSLDQEIGGIWHLISMQTWQLQVLIMEILQGGGAAIPSPLHFQVTISISISIALALSTPSDSADVGVTWSTELSHRK